MCVIRQYDIQKALPETKLITREGGREIKINLKHVFRSMSSLKVTLGTRGQETLKKGEPIKVKFTGSPSNNTGVYITSMSDWYLKYQIK